MQILFFLYSWFANGLIPKRKAIISNRKKIKTSVGTINKRIQRYQSAFNGTAVIAYLEKNWVIEKEPIEISFVIENATERYLKLRIAHPDIDKRISQQHIASHLGITPTQLSRIRKSLKNNS